MPNLEYLARLQAWQARNKIQIQEHTNNIDNEFSVKKEFLQGAKEHFDETGEMRPLVVETFWGDHLHVLVPEIVGNVLFLYGTFELDVTHYMLNTIEPGMTVLDVGAHFGTNTMLAATLVGPTGQVHAFEPMPATFALLSRNADGKQNATVNQRAVWNETTMLAIRNFGPEMSALTTVRVPRIPLPPRLEQPPVSVPTITLDEYVAEHNLAPAFVKIDVEGAEPEVLQGMENVLRRFRPALVIELVDAGPTFTWSCRQLVDHLLNHSYQAFEYDAKNRTLRPHQPTKHYSQNLLFVPN